MSIQNDTRNKIKKWILEEKKLGLSDRGASKLNAFALLVTTKDSKRIPIQMIGSKTNDRKILVCWIWGLPREHAKIIKTGIPNAVKKKCESEISTGLSLMNLPVVFEPSMEELEKIRVEQFIHLDGLTKDRLYDVINKLLRAYVFTARKLVEHFKIPRQFDRFTGV